MKTIELGNNLVLLHDNTTAKHALIDISFNFGSAFESPKDNGIAHYIEHLVFTGTKDMPRFSVTNKLESYGALVNAYTSKDRTNYFFESPSKYFFNSVDVLMACLDRPFFDPKEIETERLIVLNEIREALDNPQRALFLDFYAGAFSNSLKMPVAGTEESVKRIKRPSFLSYFKKFYSPNNATGVVLGKLNKNALIDSFSVFKERKKPNIKLKENKFVPGNHEQHRPNLKQCHLILGFPAMTAKDKDVFSFILSNGVLSTGLGSRLKKEVREKRGLAYQIDTFFDYSNNYGLFGVYVACAPKNKEKVEELILKEFDKLSDKEVSKAELDVAKRKAEAEMIMASSTPLNKAELLINCHRFGWEGPEGFMDKINAVQGKDIKAVAKKYLSLEPLIVKMIPETKETSKK